MMALSHNEEVVNMHAKHRHPPTKDEEEYIGERRVTTQGDVSKGKRWGLPTPKRQQLRIASPPAKLLLELLYMGTCASTLALLIF